MSVSNIVSWQSIQQLTKVSLIHPLVTIDVSAKFHDKWTDQQTDHHCHP